MSIKSPLKGLLVGTPISFMLWGATIAAAVPSHARHVTAMHMHHIAKLVARSIVRAA